MANPFQVRAIRVHLPQGTKDYIEKLYANPFIHALINHPQYQALYFGVLFRHFRQHFEQKSIGNSNHHSKLPSLLRALGLLPADIQAVARYDLSEMQHLWTTLYPHLQLEPIECYRQTVVRVPRLMASVFQNDDACYYQTSSRMVRYDYLVQVLQNFVGNLTGSRVRSLKMNDGQRLRFKAIYWLTVLDQFVRAVQQMPAGDGAQLVSPFPHTALRLIRGQQSALPHQTCGSYSDDVDRANPELATLGQVYANPFNHSLIPNEYPEDGRDLLQGPYPSTQLFLIGGLNGVPLQAGYVTAPVVVHVIDYSFGTFGGSLNN